MRRLLSVIALVIGTGTAVAAAAEPLVTAETLRSRLGDPDLVIIDIRTGEQGAGAKAFAEAHIPGAAHADYTTSGWRALKDGVTVYLPSPQVFESLVGELGVSNDSHVVIVHAGADDSDFGGAARVYWTFKAMGHAKLSILNGGFKAWRADAANPVAAGQAKPEPALYEAKPDPSLRATVADLAPAQAAGALLVDARPPAFFAGKEKHKAVLAAGHIPGAVSQSHAAAFTPAARVKDRSALAAAYAGIGEDKPVISYCNTGHWAATNWFVLSELLGRKSVKLYDGSMLDYASDPVRPVANPAGQKGSS